MVKKVICRFMAVMFLISVVSADVTKEDVDKAIHKEKLHHPYLYFSKQEKPAILNRIKTNPEFGDVMNKLLAEANRLVYMPVETIAPPRQANPRFEAKYEHENYLANNASSAYLLAFVYQITGDAKYADKAFRFVDGVCDQPTWVHMAHEFPSVYDRVWPWGVKDDQVVFSYMQWTDNLVCKIAAVYDWLYPALEKRQRDRIRGALLEKAILRVRGNYEYLWWAAAYRCNWCSVLNSSLGVAATALLTEDPQLTDVIAESYNRVGRVLDEIHEGGWQEGIGYMSYMINESVRFGEVLKRVTDNRLNLCRHPRVTDAIRTFIYAQIPPDRSVHFGDSEGARFGSYGLFNNLMLETGSPYASWLRNNFTSNTPSVLEDLLKPRCDVKPALPGEPSVHFPGVEWVILRSDFTDPEKVTIVTKSGMNDDPHHGHLDQGHFSLYWHGQEFLCDNGNAGYDQNYFDQERWDHPFASTIGHNTVMVNGEQQICAKQKDQPWKEGIGGRVVVFKPGSGRDYVITDPAGAYPKKELKGWRRHIVLEKPVITVLVDEVISAKGAEIETRFHSAVPFEVRRAYVLLKGTENNMMALIPVSEGEFTIRSGKHAILTAQREAQFRWVPYFGTLVKAKSEKTLVGSIILPVADAAEAEKIAASVKSVVNDSGAMSLVFQKAGKEFRYLYKKGRDGLALE